MERKGKWIAVTSGIAAMGMAAVGIARYAAADRLASIAFDRECPSLPVGGRRRLKGSPDDDAFGQILAGYAAALEKKKTKTVTITAQDGTSLVGHWHPCDHPKRVILAMHGWRSSWDHDFGMVADFFSDHDCSVLYAEQRGQNGSGGAYIGFGVLERFDCLDWLAWIANTAGEDLPVYLVGISMGATTVMLASGLSLPAAVKGIVADCGFTSIEAISRHVLKNNLGYSISRRSIDRRCRSRLHMGAKEISTTQALSKAEVPLLLVHGAEDRFVPVSMAYENFSACAAPKTLLIVPKADHGMSYYLDPGSYEKAVLDFWKKYDG